MPRSRSIVPILLRGALRRARRVFKPGIPGSTVTYAYTPDSLDAGYSVLTPSNAVLTRALFRDPQRRGLILSVSNLVNGVVSGSSFDYTYDALGRPVVRNMDEFGYNPRGEIAWARYGTNTLADIYDYDSIGNFTSNRLRGAWSQFEANELNEYAAIVDDNPRSLAYDADGNLLTNGVWSYAYDSLNRLSVICSNDLVVTENAYDPFYRRVFRHEPSGEHGYLYDDWNPIRETVTTTETTTAVDNYWGKDLSGALQGAGGVGGLLAVNRTDVFFFLAYDNLGNVVSYRNATGVSVADYVYNAFGRVSCISRSLVQAFPQQFSSKQHDYETGLDYYGFRFYLSSIGRWLTRDPMGEKTELSVFTSARNNTLQFIDYLGLRNLSLYYFATDIAICEDSHGRTKKEKKNYWLLYHSSTTVKDADQLLTDIKTKLAKERETDPCACVSDLHIFSHGTNGGFDWFELFDGPKENEYSFNTSSIKRGKQLYDDLTSPNPEIIQPDDDPDLNMYRLLVQLSSFLCDDSIFEVLSCYVGLDWFGKELQDVLDPIFPRTKVILPKPRVAWVFGTYSYGMTDVQQIPKRKDPLPKPHKQ